LYLFCSIDSSDEFVIKKFQNNAFLLAMIATTKLLKQLVTLQTHSGGLLLCNNERDKWSNQQVDNFLARWSD